VNHKILPQYTLAFEADDATLVAKAKELPATVVEGTHWNDAGMNRRLKEYRAKNPETGNVKDFFNSVIGPANVLSIDVTLSEQEQLTKMKEIIEQKGKPCCINMITDSDKKFLADLEKQALKEEKARAKESAAQAEAPTPSDQEDEAEHKNEQSEEEVDEITKIILQEEKSTLERLQLEEAEAKQRSLEQEQQKIKDEKAAEKLEKLRDQERDLLD